MKTETDDEFIALRAFIVDWLNNRQSSYVHLGVSEDKFNDIALLNGPFAPRELLTDEASRLAYLSRVFAMPPDNLGGMVSSELYPIPRAPVSGAVQPQDDMFFLSHTPKLFPAFPRFDKRVLRSRTFSA